MNKNELIKEVSIQSKLTQKDCKQCLEALKEVMKKTLKSGDDVCVSGFGRFFIKHYEKRNAFNPQTRQISTLKERFLPVFKVSSVFKTKI